MPIPVACAKYGAKLRVPDGAAGKTGKCPKCQAPLRVPADVAGAAADLPVRPLGPLRR